MRAKIPLLYVLKLFGAFAIARFAYRHQVRILCYHGIWRGGRGFAGDGMFMRAETFAARLRALHQHGYAVIALDRAVSGLRGETPLPLHAVVITIDDGWYGTFAEMLPALKQMQMPATIYCDTANLTAGLPVPHVMARYLRRVSSGRGPLSSEAQKNFSAATDLTLDRRERYAAMLSFARLLGIGVEKYLHDRVFSYMTADELAAAARFGFSIELHTHNHSLHDFQPDQIANEIALNRRTLGALLGRPETSFRHFCYPSGEVAPGVGRVLGGLGILSATTLESGLVDRRSDLYLLARITDGEHLSAIEFEAEMCGIGDLLRKLRRWKLPRLNLPRNRMPARDLSRAHS